MDVASYIAGILKTAPFNPGPATPPPFNTQHTGLTNGSSPTSASANVAELYNRVLLNLYATVQHAGLTQDHNNWTQFITAVRQIINTNLGTGPAGGALRAKANFGGINGSPIILYGFNIASITRYGPVGNPAFDIVFTTPFDTANWVASYMSQDVWPPAAGPGHVYEELNKTASGVRIGVFDNNPGGWEYAPYGFTMVVFK